MCLVDGLCPDPMDGIGKTMPKHQVETVFCCPPLWANVFVNISSMESDDEFDVSKMFGHFLVNDSKHPAKTKEKQNKENIPPAIF